MQAPETHPISTFPVKSSDVLGCSFSSWYPTLKDVTIRSEFLPLSREFVAYLNADGVVVPDAAFGKFKDTECTDVEETDFGPQEDADEETPKFPEFEKQINERIASLGGFVHPKLNWSSPKDVTWMSADSTLKCRNAAEIFLLLKSSDFVTRDLSTPFEHCADASSSSSLPYHLVLRKWTNIEPAMEFRCFVRSKRLVGISQRHYSNYVRITIQFPFLKAMKDEIKVLVKEFFEKRIRDVFPLEDYSFDVYLDRAKKVILVDFGTFGGHNDALLFHWEELHNIEGLSADFTAIRIIDDGRSIVASPLASYRLPHDILDVSNEDGIKAFVETMKRTNNIQDTQKQP